MTIIVGSGPAGIAAAHAFVRAGKKITLIDGGETLEEPYSSARERMSQTSPEKWSLKDLKLVQAELAPSSSGVPIKLSYGSDFPYRGGETVYPLERRGADFLPSLATGGLSTVWGSALMPYSEHDLKDWPISLHDLEPHYRAAIELTGQAGDRDGLEASFPRYQNSDPTALKASAQALDLLAQFERHKDDFAKQAIIFGKSRVAVKKQNPSGQSCNSCGLCMYGCPYELIYSSHLTLRSLLETGLVDYRPGVLLKKFREVGDQVEVECWDRARSKTETFRVDRLLIGAGVLPTASILLNSMGTADSELVLKDSQYLLLPLISFKASRGAETEKVPTLAQVFMELLPQTPEQKTLHLQFYTYSDLFLAALKRMFGPLFWIVRPFLLLLLRRLVIIQGYLHSDSSSKIRIRLKDGGLEMLAEKNPKTSVESKRLTRTLLKNCLKLGGVPLSFAKTMSLAGRGYHVGGSLPMSKHPEGFESDCFGRPTGHSRVHVIDASVFPTIPATTITLSVMANAHRIATAILKGELLAP